MMPWSTHMFVDGDRRPRPLVGPRRARRRSKVYVALVTSIPLSVLDLTVLNDGQSSGQALAATTELARAADALGFRRFWVAEHHNMPSVACTAPTVLMAHLAASTSTIRVGSGG